MKQTDKRKLSPSAQEAIRLQAVDLVEKQKAKVVDVCRLLAVSRSALQGWLAAYRAGGKKVLKAQKQGRPKEIRLNKEQVKQVKKLITDKLPEQLKLPFGLWTREAVQQLIRKLFKIEISITTSGRYLKQWGYSPQKPIYKAYEQSSKEVKSWLDKEYPAIKSSAAKEGADIHWGDETGMRSDHQAGTSYAPKGKTPVVKKTGKRFRINMISSLTNKGELAFMIYKTSFSSEVFIRFMEQLIKDRERKVYLIVGRHSAHKTKKVKAWLEEHKSQIAMHYLPAYSPKLNLDELVNQDLKTNIIGKKRTLNADQMSDNVSQFLRSRQKDKEQVKKYFHGNYVRYAA